MLIIIYEVIYPRHMVNENPQKGKRRHETGQAQKQGYPWRSQDSAPFGNDWGKAVALLRPRLALRRRTIVQIRTSQTRTKKGRKAGTIQKTHIRTTTPKEACYLGYDRRGRLENKTSRKLPTGEKRKRKTRSKSGQQQNQNLDLKKMEIQAKVKFKKNV